MAKSKSFFGLRQGSTKSLTFAVLNGKQVTKDRVMGGKNPRSQAQMVQRMCMATASAAYAAMKQIVDHSFEGYAYGSANMSRFISLNTKAIKADYDAEGGQFGFNPYGDRQLKQGGYIVSQGNASAISKDVFHFSRGSSDNSVDIILPAVGESEVVSANALMEHFGCNVGDMATVVAIAPAYVGSENYFIFVRVKFLKSGTAGLTTANLADYIKIESNVAIGSATVETGMIQIPLTSVKIDNTFHPNYGVIHSVKTSNGWLRSNVTLEWYTSDEYPVSAADALATYPVGETYVLNGGAISQ